jgi:hypothetical protein
MMMMMIPQLHAGMMIRFTPKETFNLWNKANVILREQTLRILDFGD